VTANGYREGDVVYEARAISKRFGPIEACVDIDLRLRRGEITAIIGDNGAGKSTLIKMLTGAMHPDEGDLVLRGEPVRFHSPLEARLKGVEVVYQELGLAPNLDVTANIFLGREIKRRIGGFLPALDVKQMTELARKEVAGLDINIPAVSGVTVGRMSGGQRQCVAIARAVYWSSDVLFLDEPTAALGVRESEAVLRLVRHIRERGVAVVMISHAMPHVKDLADHVVVLKHGRKVADLRHEELSISQLVHLIVEGSAAQAA